MKLNILDINRYIEIHKLQQITSMGIFASGKNNKIDENGLFSETIFGRLGSKQRRVRFAYIDLRHKFIHPECWTLVLGIHPIIGRILLKKNKYIIDELGNLVEHENGNNGLLFLINNFDNIKFENLEGVKEINLKFVKNNMQKVFTDKWLVLPAGIRDIQISSKSGKVNIEYSEISEMYQYLLRYTNSINVNDINSIGEGSYELFGPIIEKTQRSIITISTWIKDRLKGKYGLIRGGLMKKTVDYSCRLIITGDPSVKFGYVGIAWHTILKLFEPFTLYKLNKEFDHINELIKFEMKYEYIDTNLIKKFLNNINLEPETVSPRLKDELFKLAEAVAKDKVVCYKRDPAENRDSWISSYIRVDDTGFVLKLNGLDVNKNGGDKHLKSPMIEISYKKYL